MSIPQSERCAVADESVSTADLEPLFRAARKIAAYRNVAVEDILALGSRVWASKAAQGGKRAGAGRHASDWVALTTHSLAELPLRLVIEQAVAHCRSGSAIRPIDAFARMLSSVDGKAGADGAAVKRLFVKYQHALKNPAKGALDQSSRRRAKRRRARLAA